MKVGLIVPGFSSDATDWCIPVLVDVVRELSRSAEVHIFALRYPHQRDSARANSNRSIRRWRYAVHGAEVHAFGGGTVRGLRRLELLLVALAGVITEHRRSPFTVLHGLWVDEPGFVAVAAARLLRIPAIVSVMGGELVAMPGIKYGGGLSRSNRLLSALAIRGASCVTAAASQSADLVQQIVWPSRRMIRSRVVRLVWGINPRLFEPPGPIEPDTSAQPALDLAGKVIVLHVGSLVPIKDHATLLRAIARVKETEPGVHLHLVGDGPLKGQLIDQARRLGLTSCVTFHGHRDRGELGFYYRGADVVAVSSRYEAQLVVALEAALCETPIVGTAVGLVADFALVEPEAAIAVPVGDDALLAAAIRAAIQAKKGRELRTAASRLVRSEYLAAHTARRLMSIYRNLATTGTAV